MQRASRLILPPAALSSSCRRCHLLDPYKSSPPRAPPPRPAKGRPTASTGYHCYRCCPHHHCSHVDLAEPMLTHNLNHIAKKVARKSSKAIKKSPEIAGIRPENWISWNLSKKIHRIHPIEPDLTSDSPGWVMNHATNPYRHRSPMMRSIIYFDLFI